MFNNSKLTEKLVERAEALKSVDIDRIKKAHNELTDLKNAHLEEFNTPNYMWVTFKHDVAINAALKKKTFKMGDSSFDLTRAQHPSDIKFENREVSNGSRNTRKYLSLFVISIVFGLGFICCGSYFIKRMQIISFLRQPPM